MLTNVIGNRFGMLVAVAEVQPTVRKNGRIRRYFLCECDCGGWKESSWDNLRSLAISNCGCQSPRHGGTGTKLHGTWHGMIQRCSDQNHAAYKNYGGRGIGVFSEWRNDFSAFRDWAMKSGYRHGLTIERLNNDAGYSPENCRWVTYAEQAKNKRSNVFVDDGAEKIIASEFSRKYGIPLSTVLYRAKRGMPCGGLNAV